VGDEPCVSWIGPGGAGHFVKMVHNGIEYGDMQLIAEAYDLLSRGAGLSAAELAEVFDRWNVGPLASYLIEISAQVFRKIDAQTRRPLVDSILDKAGQKGTGRWTVQAALELGIPVPTITAAVEARSLSALKTERERAAGVLGGTDIGFQGERDEFVGLVEQALYAAKVASYAQGFALMEAASREYHFDLDLGEIARIWRGGCIIRADFLNDIRAAYADEPGLPNLLLAPFFTAGLTQRQAAWRLVVQAAAEMGLPAPAMAASLAYYDGYRSARLPANLIQGQRDLFGAHTFERTDKQGVFHADWSRD
jgi:6-phosphogluconate dehydrogenase